MPAIAPIRRKDLIRNLKKLGYDGPYSGGKHQYMVRGKLRLTLPNPHKGEIGKFLLIRILRQADINRKEWELL